MRTEFKEGKQMRKYLRQMARYNMTAQGIERFNKSAVNPATGNVVKSYFSREWRNYVY